ncbi:MAG: hypothetical protein J5843_02285 [Clostridia bacterium]|nr:hypothetical protein [Clostridia bacterium]
MKRTDSAAGATRRTVSSLLFLVLAAALAAAGAVVFRDQAGIWRTVPLLPLCMIAAAFLPVSVWQRALLFLIPVVALTSVEQTDTGTVLLLSVLAAVLFALTECGVRLIRKKRKTVVRIVCGILILCLAFAAYAAVCGNPFSALSARKAVRAYTDRTYDPDGNISFTPLTYDVRTRLYGVYASSASYPNERGAIAVNGPIVEDRFLPLLEDQYMRLPSGAFTSVLRETFPHDDFTAYRVSVSGFSVRMPFRDPAGVSVASGISYCVELSGKPLYPQMAEAAEAYANVLASSGVPFRSVSFVSVQTFHTRYRASAVPYGMTMSGCAGVRPSVFAMRCGDMLSFLQRSGNESLLETYAKAAGAAVSSPSGPVSR